MNLSHDCGLSGYCRLIFPITVKVANVSGDVLLLEMQINRVRSDEEINSRICERF